MFLRFLDQRHEETQNERNIKQNGTPIASQRIEGTLGYLGLLYWCFPANFSLFRMFQIRGKKQPKTPGSNQFKQHTHSHTHTLQDGRGPEGGRLSSSHCTEPPKSMAWLIWLKVSSPSRSDFINAHRSPADCNSTNYTSLRLPIAIAVSTRTTPTPQTKAKPCPLFLLLSFS